ncbi:exodeoxyribonuclease V subunit gamma [Aestuariirhabdus litorea]|uniref:RecBCD enzyme subunit RecC n=1 Tax=Aestuariirhabdus litorea TaxID=2528527 RepID=A0A3P3VRZ3_9GAMM|nr:exodeoxyribonuclease V subunit gamma [Aestuariirhabdus litorea]RRJ85214.1 exodeoxyribonuclease V subunit gamma [Aestuariirhabdus litorea]RWW98435.1 exodeoxyribonuclease V subunit gamma [Endozoicomonadaceae bacterium GTF-13]
MLKIYHSNFAEIHQALIADTIREQPLVSPLADEVVLVQSPGMAQWLKQRLAANLGVAANIRFPLPSSFIWELFTRVFPDMPEESAFNKESMGWVLMQLLPRFLSQPEFSSLRGYLADDPAQRKRYQLAMKVADIFDQYLVYRPQWILDWEQEKAGTEAEAEHPWQPILWRALVAYNRERGGNEAHRANLQQRFIDRLASQDDLDLPERIFLFGVSALAPQYLEVLHHLGQRCDVHLMQLNPCRHYWGDLQDPAHQSWQAQASGLGGDNPLLASMGKLGRDYQAQLHGLDPALAVEHREHFIERPPTQLLGMLQGDLLELNNRGALPPGTPLPDDSHHKTPLPAGDGSLELHSCHSPMREVEVLHDRLLALFNADPNLQPRDVLVMVPQIDHYSAAIQSVFGSREHPIPYSIADRGVQAENPLLVSFFQLLQIPGSRFEVTRLLDILEVPQVMERFDLQQDEFDELRDWIRESGIRWGLDAEQLSSAGLYPQQQNSWRFGVRRMLLGLSRREREGSFAAIQPFEGIEGLGAQKLGKLIDYLEQLDTLQQRLTRSATVDQWQQRCQQLLQDFYSKDSDTEYSFRLILRALDQLVKRLKGVGFEEPLSPEVFLEHLQATLQDEGGSHRFLAGQVNFCTLMPMRSIPFRVICLLGMNDGAYPRSLPPMGFDLMAVKPRLGDRSRRDDDRYLFLEALLSAREKLYISYVGRSIRDNSERVPSVLVTELVEYCQQGFVAAGESDLSHRASAERLLAGLQRQHSLQPFGRQNFLPGADSAWDGQSFDRRWLSVAQTLEAHQLSGPGQPAAAFCAQPLPPPDGEQGGDLGGDAGRVEMPALSRFFDNSARYFFNQRLRVFFDQFGAMEEADEPFEEDPLLRYRACTELVERQLRGESPEPWQQQLRLSGELPHAGFGEHQLIDWQARAHSLEEPLRRLRRGPEQVKTLEISLPSGRLLGRIGNLFEGERLVLWRAGKLRDADCLRLWLHHLALNACGTPTHSFFITIDEYAQLQAIEQAEWARDRLDSLLQLFQQGLQQPLALPLQAAMAWARSLDKGGDEAQCWTKASAAWEGGEFKSGDADDPYWSRLYPSADALRDSDLPALAEAVLLPMLRALKTGKLESLKPEVQS